MNWKEEFKAVARALNLDFYQQAWLEDWIDLWITKEKKAVVDLIEETLAKEPASQEFVEEVRRKATFF